QDKRHCRWIDDILVRVVFAGLWGHCSSFQNVSPVCCRLLCGFAPIRLCLQAVQQALSVILGQDWFSTKQSNGCVDGSRCHALPCVLLGASRNPGREDVSRISAALRQSKGG